MSYPPYNKYKVRIAAYGKKGFWIINTEFKNKRRNEARFYFKNTQRNLIRLSSCFTNPESIAYVYELYKLKLGLLHRILN